MVDNCLVLRWAAQRVHHDLGVVLTRSMWRGTLRHVISHSAFGFVARHRHRGDFGSHRPHPERGPFCEFVAALRDFHSFVQQLCSLPVFDSFDMNRYLFNLEVRDDDRRAAAATTTLANLDLHACGVCDATTRVPDIVVQSASLIDYLLFNNVCKEMCLDALTDTAPQLGLRETFGV